MEKIITDSLFAWFSAGMLFFLYWAAKFTATDSFRKLSSRPSWYIKVKWFLIGASAAGVAGLLSQSWTVLITTLGPISLGVYIAFKQDKHLTHDQRDQRDRELANNEFEAKRNDDGW